MLVLATVVSFGQKKDAGANDGSDFVGTWKYETSEAPSLGLESNLKRNKTPYFMVVVQSSQSLTITYRRLDGKEAAGPTYYLDGRGETNQMGDTDNPEVSTTKLGKHKLTIQSTTKLKDEDIPALPKGAIRGWVGNTRHTEYVWKISDNGQRLSIRICQHLGEKVVNPINFPDPDLCYTDKFRKQ
jgi:hypothetical protein